MPAMDEGSAALHRARASPAVRKGVLEINASLINSAGEAGAETIPSFPEKSLPL